MPQSMPNAARPAGRLFARRASVDRLIARFALVVHSFLTRLSPAAACLSHKYFRIKCVDNFYFRFKYITATYARGTAYAFENKIESRKLLQNQMRGPDSKKRGPMESNTCTPSGGRGGRGEGGPPTELLCDARARPSGSSSQSPPVGPGAFDYVLFGQDEQF
jgi:hypothetical protein